MSPRPLGLHRVAGEMPDAVGHPSLSRVPSGRLHRLREIENGRVELGVRRAECERVGAASAADVEEALAAAELHALRHHPRWPERAGVLGRAEGLAADPGGIDHALVEALVGKNALAAKRGGEMPKRFVAESAVHEAHIVAEVARRARHQKFRRRGSVGEPVFALDDQTDRL